MTTKPMICVKVHLHFLRDGNISKHRNIRSTIPIIQQNTTQRNRGIWHGYSGVRTPSPQQDYGLRLIFTDLIRKSEVVVPPIALVSRLFRGENMVVRCCTAAQNILASYGSLTKEKRR